MRLSIISFTENGIALSEKIAKMWQETECVLYTKCRTYDKKEHTVQPFLQSIAEWAKEQFEQRNAILFIGACGIAVRAIAPHLTDKLSDSPVLVMDEKGQYVIPILSGHVGGANELAVLLAEKMRAQAVLTTATDIQHQFAVDLFAKKNGLAIMNKDGIAKVSSRVLAGKRITMAIEPGHCNKDQKLPKEVELAAYPPTQKVDVVVSSENRQFETALFLKPKEYALGIGCKKGKEAEKIETFIMRNLQIAGIAPVQVFGMASIEVKREEEGLLAWSRKEKIPFITYSAEELRAVKGDFHVSDFVKEQVGVDNVCERAAMKMCEPGGKLVYEKHAEDGMTIAIAKREWRVHFDEE